MPLEYTIRFTPGRYYIAPMGGAGAPPPAPGVKPTSTYFAVVDENSRLAVAFAFDEQAAMAISFALDLANAVLNGDKARERELLRALGRIA